MFIVGDWVLRGIYVGTRDDLLQGYGRSLDLPMGDPSLIS